MNLLVTGGTVFASRYTAEYFRDRGHRVCVLNRGTRPQSDGVTLIKCDRHQLGNTLKTYAFDAVLDVSSYTETDVTELLAALPPVKQYIFVSSSAVYPETNPQPFMENQPCGSNASPSTFAAGVHHPSTLSVWSHEYSLSRSFCV